MKKTKKPKRAEQTEARPALRISNIAYGRRIRNNKVTYLVDPRGLGDKRAIPEKVVLFRWRRRERPAGHVFCGARLSSTIWRALPVLLGTDVKKWLTLSKSKLCEKREAKKVELRELHLKIPKADALWALLSYCGRKNLSALVARHNRPDRVGRSGVPDLFLFARKTERKPAEVWCRPAFARFVEVKKPKERVSEDQRDEIAVLNDRKLHARVFSLMER